jgi:hypothetical protein
MDRFIEILKLELNAKPNWTREQIMQAIDISERRCLHDLHLTEQSNYRAEKLKEMERLQHVCDELFASLRTQCNER